MRRPRSARLSSVFLIAIWCVPSLCAQDGLMIGGAVSGSLSMGLPLGLPPGSTDARMLSVPPNDVAAFVTWSNVAKPKPTSQNRTEQLLSDPQVQTMLQNFATNYQNAIANLGNQDPSMGAVAAIGSKFLDAIVTHESSVYFRMQQDRAAGGFVCDLGSDAQPLSTVLASLAQMSGGQIVSEQIDSLTVYSIREAPLPTQITIGNRFLILAVGKDELTSIVSRLKAPQVAPWLEAARARVAVPRLANLSYVNVDHFAESIDDGFGLPEELAALKIDGLRSMACATGLDDNGVIVRTHFQCDDPLRQKLKKLSGTLQPDDTSLVAPDSIVSAAIAFQAKSVATAIMDTVEAVEPGAAAQTEASFRQVTGVDLYREMIPALGDSLQLYISPSEGGRLLTGLTAAFSINDPAVIGKAIEQIEKRLVQSNAPFRIRSRQFAGKTVSYLVGHRPEGRYRRGTVLGFVPAWCFDGDQLIVSTFPQNIYALLERDSGQNQRSQALGSGDPAPWARITMDEKSITEIVYPLLKIAATMALSELDDDLVDLVDIDLGVLPSLPSITKHMDTATIRFRFDEGLQIVRHQTLPPTGISAIAGGVLLGETIEYLIDSPLKNNVPEVASDELAADDADENAPIEVAAMNGPSAANGLPPTMPSESQTPPDEPAAQPDTEPLLLFGASAPLANVMRLQNARKLLDQGRYQEAILEFAGITATDPKNYAAQLGLADAFYQSRQYEKAAETYQKCVDLDPQKSQGYIGRGKTHWVQDRNEQSLPDFKKALAIDPDSEEAWRYQGLAHSSLKNYQDAVTSLSEAIKRDPELWITVKWRADAYYSLKKNELAIDDYTRAIELRPGQSSSYLYRAFTYRRLDESKKAIADFTSRLEYEPLDKTALEYRGDEYRATGQTKRAIRDYNALIGLEPDHVEAFRGRASALLDLDEPQRSIEDYTRVIALSPNKYDYVNRAIGWEELGRFDRAVDDYTSALELDPKYVTALKWRAPANQKLEKYAQAKADFAAAIAVAGDDDSTLLGNFSWLLAACPDDEIRDGNLALKYATRASELTQEKEAWIIDNVAAAHAELGNFAEAIRFANLAIEAAQSDAVREDIRTRLNNYQNQKPARF